MQQLYTVGQVECGLDSSAHLPEDECPCGACSAPGSPSQQAPSVSKSRRATHTPGVLPRLLPAHFLSHFVSTSGPLGIQAPKPMPSRSVMELSIAFTSSQGVGVTEFLTPHVKNLTRSLSSRLRSTCTPGQHYHSQMGLVPATLL